MQHRNIFKILCLFLTMTVFPLIAFSQDKQGAKERVKISSLKKNRTSGVKIGENQSNADAEKDKKAAENARREEQERLETEKKKAEEQERLEAEKKKIAEETAAKVRSEMQQQIETERLRAEQLEKEKSASENEKAKLLEQAELEKQKNAETVENAKKAAESALAAKEKELAELKAKNEADRLEKERLENEKQRTADENAEKARLLEEAKQKVENERLLKERLLKEAEEKAAAEKLEQERLLKETNQKAEAERLEKERLEKEAAAAKEKAAQLEKEKEEAEKLAASIEAEKEEKAKLRHSLIELAAKKLKFINVPEAVKLVSENAQSAEAVETELKAAAAKNPKLVNLPSFCDADFEGDSLNMMLSANPTLGGLLNELSSLFNINFLPDPEVLNLAVAGDVKNVPWNYVLRSQLNYNDLDARCIQGNTIAIMKRQKLQTLNDEQKKNAPLKTEFIKLKYLQASVGGAVNVAGKGGSGGSVLQSLEQAINKILKADGDNRGSISQIPGRNEYIITATDEQLEQIKKVIGRADRPAYQVVIYSSIVTANENKLRDVGGQFTAVGGTADLGLLGGLLGLGGNSASSSTGSGASTSNTTGGTTSTSSSNNSGGSALTSIFQPGGVPKLGGGFSSPPTGGSVLGVSNIFGSVQLSAQLSLLSQKGAVKIDNRPFVAVLDGQTTNLDIGRQIAIPIAAQNNFGGSGGSLEILNAGNTLSVTPQVIEDENGNPVAVTMQVRIESNDVDGSVVSGGVPSIIRRSTQTSLMLNQNQTAVVGGFSTDSESNSETKTPGLGDVPILGGLFKRKVKTKNSDRLYFTIRAVVVSQGEILQTVPLNVDTTPRLPNPNNDFFKPYNQPVETVKKP